MNKWNFAWDCGEGEVHSLGGMMAPVKFNISGNRTIQPFSIAPWSSDSSEEFHKLPPILKNLRGEWSCVPFGVSEGPKELPLRWQSTITDDESCETSEDGFSHGPSSNQHWHLVDSDNDSLTIRLNYPESHPIEYLERNIKGVQGQAAVEIQLKVKSRRRSKLPIGIHPTFRLPKKIQTVELEFLGEIRASSFPVQFEQGISRFLPDQENMQLQNIDLEGGGKINASLIPLSFSTEELLQIDNHKGFVRLKNKEENYQIEMSWQPQDFPSCLLWYSNKGRTQYPWNGRFLAIGVEPIASAFDLGVAQSLNSQQPKAKEGISCYQEFDSKEIWQTRYTIAVSAL